MDHYKIIEKAIHYLMDHREAQPDLSELSAYTGLSEFHLQRVFSEWAGISPKQFLQYLTKEYAITQLSNNSVMETAHLSGLSGTSRLHDLLISWEGMTPGEFKNSGIGVTIYFDTMQSPFGHCFIAVTKRGVCKLAFFDNESEQQSLEVQLRKEWHNATIIKDKIHVQPIAQQIFGNNKEIKKPLKLLLKGTKFQIKVWEALLAIPEGQLRSYRDVAESIGHPKAVRAVASAVAKNNIALLIPCHRVIRETGDFGKYRWKEARKRMLIAWEAIQK